MKEVGIDSLTAGMLFAQDVVDAQGRILVARDTEVIQKHIRILKSWGIEQVAIITGGPAEATRQEHHCEPELLEALRQRLNDRFAHTNREHPAIQALYNISLQRALAASGGQQSDH